MTDYNTIIETGLYQKIASITALLSFITNSDGSLRIFNTQAPAHTSYPFVLFHQAYSTRFSHTQRTDIHAMYYVSVYALDDPTARQLYGYIYPELHKKELTLSENWYNYWCYERQLYHLIENVEANQYYRRGAIYEIHVANDSQ